MVRRRSAACKQVPLAPSVFACGRTKSTDSIAINFTILFIVGMVNFGRMHQFRWIVMGKLNRYLGPQYVYLVNPPGGRAPGVAATPQKARPPSLTDEERGEVANQDGGASRPFCTHLLVLTTGTYRNFLIALRIRLVV